MGGQGLVPIEQYIRAVLFFIRRYNLGTVHIFLTTEDLKASIAFRSHPLVVSRNWTIYEYVAAIPPKATDHSPAVVARESKGRYGLTSLVALLLSLEAQYYILTTASNWSRLILALVNGIVSKSTPSVTVDYIDLRCNPVVEVIHDLFKKQQQGEGEGGGRGERYPLCPKHPYNRDGVLFLPILEDCPFALPPLDMTSG
jgi:hypothetical protein